VILGGPDALEGVGEIVRIVLNEEEEMALRLPGVREFYVKDGVWNRGQKVVVIAGSDRELTRMMVLEKMEEVLSEVKEGNVEGLIGIKEVLTAEESSLNLNCGVRFHLTCNGIYNSFEIDKRQYLVRASESEWQDYQSYVNNFKNNSKTIAYEKALWDEIERLRNFERPQWDCDWTGFKLYCKKIGNESQTNSKAILIR
jgi:hypothetical protein